jgi:hypothetical protein
VVKAELLKVLIVIALFLTAFASGSNSMALLVAIPSFSLSNLAVAVAEIIVGTIFSAPEIKKSGNRNSSY